MAFWRSMAFVMGHPLAKKRRIAALGRYLRWQLASRLLGEPVVHEWVNGTRFMVRGGEAGLTGNIYAGLHDFEDMAFVLHVLRPCDVFADVGANAGSYTVLASAAVGARSFAFEPVPETFSRLVENVRINHAENCVKCINKAVAEKPGVIEFSLGSDTTNRPISNGEKFGKSVFVNATTLDEAFLDVTPALIKIDVEGFETLVLRGASKTLAAKSLLAVILELNGNGQRYGFDDGQIARLMYEMGFEAYEYEPFSRKLKLLNGSNSRAGNTIFVRDRKTVEARLTAAPPFSVLGMEL